jgi:hypothetical protein
VPGVAMDVYAGTSYTGQAALASGVTSYHQATGGTFVINLYSTNSSNNQDPVQSGLTFTN